MTDRAPLDASLLRSGLLGPGRLYAAVEVAERTASTNADAADLARAGRADGTVVTADHQTAGRGRLDRTFEIPERSGIAVSVLLRPDGVPLQRWVWLPLLAGLALDDTLRDLGVVGALKWPNDVLVDGRKISGILLERVETPGGAAAVVGIGLNVTLGADELPVPTATSLALAGATDLDRGSVTVRLLGHLERHYRSWLAAGEESDARLRAAYRAACDTVGRDVDVTLPDGSILTGPATDIDEHGRLVVAGTAVSAGDVTHVRPRAGRA